MAFTGSPTSVYVADNLARLTFGLAHGASGTIGLAGDTGAGVQLPALMQPTPYTDPDGNLVDLTASLEISFCNLTNVATQIALQVAKGGSPFRLTITNNDAAVDIGANGIEAYVRWHK